MVQTKKEEVKEVEKTLSHGNKGFLFYPVCILLSVLVIVFGSYKDKMLTKIKHSNKELISYEYQLNEMNKSEIQGIN